MQEYLQAVAAIVAITSPLDKIPVFLGITENLSTRDRMRSVLTVMIASGVILVGAVFVGRTFLGLFGISLPAFQTAGGLVLILVGLEMLHGEPTRIQTPRSNLEEVEDSLLVPLTVPLFAGPGAISTVITLSISSQDAGAFPGPALVGVLMTILLIGIALSAAVPLSQILNQRIQKIIIRFLGLILLSIGFQLGLSGVATFFK